MQARVLIITHFTTVDLRYNSLIDLEINISFNAP